MNYLFKTFKKIWSIRFGITGITGHVSIVSASWESKDRLESSTQDKSSDLHICDIVRHVIA